MWNILISNTSYEDMSLNYMGFINVLLYFISITSYEDMSLYYMGFIDILLYFISNTSYEDVLLNYMGFIDILLYFISNTSYDHVSLNYMGFIDVLLYFISNTSYRASVSCRRPTHPSARYRSALAGILQLIIFFDWPFTFLRLVQPLEMSLQPLAKILVEALSYEDVSLNHMGFIDVLLYFVSITSYEDVSITWVL